MIKISIVRDNQGVIREFTVKGHANYRDSGKDIVCAAISVLAQTAVGALQEIIGKENCNYTIDDGYLKCSLPVDISDDKKDKAATILETIAIGFEQVRRQYKRFVKVFEEEV